MSPIYVRPAREQSEHDRLIRFLQRQLQAKYKKKLDITIHPGDEQALGVKVGPAVLFPDLVLSEGKTPVAIVEIETGESVNNLESMHQWVPFSRTKVAFHLYVPVPGWETAKRLLQTYQARVTEIWTYRSVNDTFDLVQMHTDPGAVNATKGTRAVLVPVAPKPVAPPPPPEPPPPPPPKPAAEAKAPLKTSKAASKGAAAPVAPAAVASKAQVPGKAPAKSAAKAVAAPAAPAPAKSAVPAKASAKPVPKPAPKPAAKPAAKAPVKIAKPVKPAPKKAAAKPSKAAKPAVKARKPAPAAGKKKGSAAKKGR